MAQGYKCRKCGNAIMMGVPQVRLTQEVSAALTIEKGRPMTFHDWGPHAYDRELHRRGEEIWEKKAQEYYTLTGNLKVLPETCPQCNAAQPWDVTIATSDF